MQKTVKWAQCYKTLSQGNNNSYLQLDHSLIFANEAKVEQEWCKYSTQLDWLPESEHIKVRVVKKSL
jgi:hypothetical protein